MKIEQLLVQHFYNTKTVTLQGIGTFTLSPDFIMPMDSDKDIVLPENAVSFKYNSRATEDESLIDYIVQQTRKIKPLASADLESYLMLGSQFLNIGKPMKIEGIGMLEKNQLGEYQFLQGQFINTKTEQAEIKLKEKSREDISFGNEAKSSNNNKKTITILAVIAAVVFIGLTAWYFFSKKKDDDAITENIVEQTVPTANTAPDTAKIDTNKIAAQQKPDSVLPFTPQVNGYTFKVVIKNYPSLFLAQKSYNRLTSYGYKLLIYTADSVIYKVAMPLTKPLIDTTRARDSVKILFGGRPYIEIK
jgi:predicted RNase H-related nuclease YkuK (DUF458 family)